MRGALHASSSSVSMVRIIPADAGSTRTGMIWRRPRQDHPRGCGEHVYRVGSSMSKLGSSPRMRGARRYLRSICLTVRIIPADAGSTRSSIVISVGSGDHPRGCGEHWTVATIGHSVKGSSPRMRGARYQRPTPFVVIGIIPADAGSTR